MIWAVYLCNPTYTSVIMMKLKTNSIIVRFMVYIQVQYIYKQTFRAPNSSPFSMHVTREEIVK